MIRYNLQFFAKEGMGGEKTEPATQKKLEDARKEGQVAKSREIANGLGLMSLFLCLKLWVGSIGNQLLEIFPSFYDRIPDISTYWGGQMPQADIQAVFSMILLRTLVIIAPLLLIGFLVAFVSDYIQVRWKPTFKPMRPKFSKLNPLKGVKKFFSVNALVELIKSVAKIGLIVLICYNYLEGREMLLLNLYDMGLMQAINLAAEIMIDLGIRISALYMLIALADFAYQKVKFKNDMKMTKQEIKEEYKQQEGDPQIKGQIRQKMREASRRRMMQDLPQADVVITNPTHYAVAIKYDPAVADAPVVLAKGEDYMAARIKEVARENKIEIVENKPLARMLYANVEIGETIPPELYQAVADVLAFVYRLQGKL